MKGMLVCLFVGLFVIGSVLGGEKCEEITIPMCKGIGYNYTRLPNQFNHETQDEAGLEVHQFWPLVEIQCSPDLRFFLCSMYTPICMESYQNPLPACRSVCERARLGCVPLMQQYGFAWPKRMSCDKLPEYGGKELCMDAQAQDAEERGMGLGGSPGSPGSPGPRVTRPNYPKPSSPHKVDGSAKTPGTCSCPRCGGDVYGGNKLVQLRPGDQFFNRSLAWAGQPNCAAPCHSPYFHTERDMEFTELWLSVWSVLCCVSTSLTFATFLMDTSRFSYPERPIMFLSFCYLLVSVGFLIRVTAGHELVSCQAQRPGQGRTYDNQLMSRAGLESSSEGVLCTTVFVLIYFFYMASGVWWVVLTFTWFLSAGLKWAQESISRLAQWYHLVAWTLPMLQTVAALLSSSIEGDPVAGICHIGVRKSNTMIGFILTPLISYLLVGISFLSAGFISLFRIRNIIKSQGGPAKIDKFEKLMVKIGIFSVLYIVPAGTVIAVAFYEVVSVSSWERSYLCPSCVPPHLRSGPNFSILMLKYFMTLAVGITSGFWIWSGKTLESWRTFIPRLIGFYHNNKGPAADTEPKLSTTTHVFTSQMRETAVHRQEDLGKHSANQTNHTVFLRALARWFFVSSDRQV